jgi:hypothetical protein
MADPNQEDIVDIQIPSKDMGIKRHENTETEIFIYD